MYTGIVTGTFKITELTREPSKASFAVELDPNHLVGIQNGASVAIDGVCMTVTRFTDKLAYFDASIETLNRTTLGELEEGSVVNIERSAKAGAEIGGHPISGHIDDKAEIIAIDRPDGNCVITFKLPSDYLKYVFNKGFIALNGCSLTVSELDKATGQFKVYLIPETLRLTTFETATTGDKANFEIDRQTQVIVDTIREAMSGAVNLIKE